MSDLCVMYVLWMESDVVVVFMPRVFCPQRMFYACCDNDGSCFACVHIARFFPATKRFFSARSSARVVQATKKDVGTYVAELPRGSTQGCRRLFHVDLDGVDVFVSGRHVFGRVVCSCCRCLEEKGLDSGQLKKEANIHCHASGLVQKVEAV